MSNQVVQSVQYDATPYAGTTNQTYQSQNATEGEMPDETETVDVLRGYARRRGARKSHSARILVPAAFADLSSIMTSNSRVDITITWQNGDTTVLSGAKMTVTPILQAVPDSAAVWYDTDTSSSDTPDTDSDSSWTKLGEPLSAIDNATFEAVTTDNAANLFTYIYGRMNHAIEILPTSSAFSNLMTEYNSGNEIRIAFEDQGGNYLLYGQQSGGGVIIDEPYHVPAIDPQTRGHIVAPVKQTGTLSDIITFPTNAENLFYGAEVQAEAFGHTEGDIFTENRTL